MKIKSNLYNKEDYIKAGVDIIEHKTITKYNNCGREHYDDCSWELFVQNVMERGYVREYAECIVDSGDTDCTCAEITADLLG